MIITLTATTQLGGIAWLIGRPFRQSLLISLASYAVLSISAIWVAPAFGRTPLSCVPEKGGAHAGIMFCVTNRHYVTPELKSALNDIADDLNTSFLGIQLGVLDASFPFLNGFPMLPHLSHNDGRKADLAFFYKDSDGRPLPGGTLRSPIGYFAYDTGHSACPATRFDLRWDLNWLQRLWSKHELDIDRTSKLIEAATADPRIRKVFLEPHLQKRLDVNHPKVRFQGCHAARHDDHIHLQL